MFKGQLLQKWETQSNGLCVLHIYVKCHENISNGFQLTERTEKEMAIFSVQRAITKKTGIPELRSICNALLYIYVKFHENISNGL